MLKSYGIAVYDLNSVGTLDLYIDGADEIDHNLHMTKGGGAALTREKIIAAASKKFVCIADESKYVKVLGQFPCPLKLSQWQEVMLHGSWLSLVEHQFGAKV